MHRPLRVARRMYPRRTFGYFAERGSVRYALLNAHRAPALLFLLVCLFGARRRVPDGLNTVTLARWRGVDYFLFYE